MLGSGWERSGRGPFSAARGDGVVLQIVGVVGDDAQFVASRDGDVFFEFVLPGKGPLDAHAPLGAGNDAIEFVDAHYPPEGWVYDAATRGFTRGDFHVRPVEGGWTAVEGAQRLSRLFQHADRARAWVEAREGVKRTRGPKARGSGAATATLPDVRATDEEAAAARETARQLGLDYSSWVRALLDLGRRITLEERLVAVVRRHDTGSALLVPTAHLRGSAARGWSVGGVDVDVVFHPTKRLDNRRRAG